MSLVGINGATLKKAFLLDNGRDRLMRCFNIMFSSEKLERQAVITGLYLLHRWFSRLLTGCCVTYFGFDFRTKFYVPETKFEKSYAISMTMTKLNSFLLVVDS